MGDSKNTSPKKVIKIAMLITICMGFMLLCLIVLSKNFTKVVPYIFSHKVVLGASTKLHASNSSLCYGAGVDMSQLLPTSQAYVKNSNGEDLIDIAAKLGINCMRITNATDAFINSDRTYTKDQWYMVLNKMQSKGIKAIILIEGPNVNQKYITSSYLPFVQKYIIASGVLSHPDVYGVDLYNEPVINNDSNISLLKKTAQMIKAANPQTKLTLGWWAVDTFEKDVTGQEIYKWDDYAAGKILNNFINFYSLHMYGFDQEPFGTFPDPYLFTKYFLTTVESALQTNKPMIIEEFGAGNGEAVSDQHTLGSPELQANVYAGVYQALLDMKDPKILGTIAYQYNSRWNGPDAWAIIKNNGDYLFPAAYVLQRYATGTSDVTFSLPIQPIPNDYMFTNNDNGKNVLVNVNDIIGLELALNSHDIYTLTSSNPSILSESQSLTYDSGHGKFDVVFHATATGTTTITIHSTNSSAEDFSLTINVK